MFKKRMGLIRKHTSSAASVAPFTPPDVLKTILRIDVDLHRFEKMASMEKHARAIRLRLGPVRSEAGKLADADTIDRATADHIFQKLLDAMPTPNHVVSPVMRAAFFQHVVDLKPQSIAGNRHLARAYGELGQLEEARKSLTALVNATKDPYFDVWLQRVKRRLEIRDQLAERLVANSAFIEACGLVPNNGSEVDAECAETLRTLLEKKTVELLGAMTAHTDQDDQFLMAEYLALEGQLFPSATPGLAEESIISAYDLRDLVQGKEVCLVANSGALLKYEYGAFIDKHDIVVRFNSFMIDPRHTGKKTTIHCSIHLKDHNRDVKVPLRLILGNDPKAWAKTVKNLDPAAQENVGDDTLRYPLHATDLCADTMYNAAPTTGYNIIRLLHLYSNFQEVHLVGFDGYTSGIYRTAEGMHEPHAAIHDSTQESDWIKAHTTELKPSVLRLIPLDNAEKG